MGLEFVALVHGKPTEVGIDLRNVLCNWRPVEAQQLWGPGPQAQSRTLRRFDCYQGVLTTLTSEEVNFPPVEGLLPAIVKLLMTSAYFCRFEVLMALVWLMFKLTFVLVDVTTSQYMHDEMHSFELRAPQASASAAAPSSIMLDLHILHISCRLPASRLIFCELLGLNFAHRSVKEMLNVLVTICLCSVLILHLLLGSLAGTSCPLCYILKTIAWLLDSWRFLLPWYYLYQ